MNKFQDNFLTVRKLSPQDSQTCTCATDSLLALQCSNKNGSEDYLQTLLLSWVTAGADIAILNTAAGILEVLLLTPRYESTTLEMCSTLHALAVAASSPDMLSPHPRSRAELRHCPGLRPDSSKERSITTYKMKGPEKSWKPGLQEE